MEENKKNIDDGVVSCLKDAKEMRAEKTGLIFDIKKYAIHDGPGIRTTVFFKGCPLRCKWCHNPESWSSEIQLSFNRNKCSGCGACIKKCPNNAVKIENKKAFTDKDNCTLCGSCIEVCVNEAREMIGAEVGIDKLMGEIEKDRVFYDESNGGVTFSGGEPLQQADFLCELLNQCRLQEIHTAVDTCCFTEPEIIEKVSENTGLFLCDLKHMDSTVHKKYTGVGNEKILNNIKLISKLGKEIILRIVLIPGFNDRDNISTTGEFAKSLGSVKQIHLLGYHRGGISKAKKLMGNYEIIDASEPEKDYMEEIAGEFQELGFQVKIGG